MWERLSNKILSGELKEAQIELGIVRSEFDEFKHEIANSKDVIHQLAHLRLVHSDLKKAKRELELKLRDRRKEEDRLVMKLAELNLKLKEYEKEKSND